VTNLPRAAPAHLRNFGERDWGDSVSAIRVRSPDSAPIRADSSASMSSYSAVVRMSASDKANVASVPVCYSAKSDRADPLWVIVSNPFV
jgi:hypothetical protein